MESRKHELSSRPFSTGLCFTSSESPILRALSFCPPFSSFILSSALTPGRNRPNLFSHIVFLPLLPPTPLSPFPFHVISPPPPLSSTSLNFTGFSSLRSNDFTCPTEHRTNELYNKKSSRLFVDQGFVAFYGNVRVLCARVCAWACACVL